MSEQTTGLSRVQSEKFYTASWVVKMCVDSASSNIHIEDKDLVLEPSAGNGAFVSKLQELPGTSKFFDLYPDHPIVKQADFLQLESTEWQGFNRVHTIGNPPFGRQSSLAIKFIKKAAMFSDSISFILPRSFKKNSMRRHFPCHFHLKSETDLPSDAFLVDGKPHDVPCVFQVWIRESYPRAQISSIEPKGYSFVRKEDEHDISVRRVGGSAGCCDTSTGDKASQSHYFLRFNDRISDHLIEKMKKMKFCSRDDTVGPRSISKPELIQELNKLM